MAEPEGCLNFGVQGPPAPGQKGNKKMILDQLSIFSDNVAMIAPSAVSSAISVSPFSGRDEPVNVTVLLNGPNATSVSLAVTLQESDDNMYGDVATFYMKKPDAAGAIMSFAIPRATKKKFVRLRYALTGSPDGLKVFAAVTRDHFAPYAEGQFIDAGKVQG
jgi:hypothetical protein